MAEDVAQTDALIRIADALERVAAILEHSHPEHDHVIQEDGQLGHPTQNGG